MKILGIDTDRVISIIWIFMALSAEVTPNFNIKKTDEDIFDFQTGEMVPYQVQPDEIKVTKWEIQKEEDQPQKYKYYIDYVPMADHYLVSKKGKNPSEVQMNDNVLLIKNGESQRMGVTNDTESNFDEKDLLNIITSLVDNDSKTGLTSIHFGIMDDPKRNLDDFEQAFYSHKRILNILKFEEEGDGEHYLHFKEEDMTLPEFNDMIPMYLNHLNSIILGPIFSKIKDMIIKISNGEDPKDIDSVNYFVKNYGDPQTKKLSEEVYKYLEGFTSVVGQNKFMMSTIKSYYVNTIRDFVNSSNVITSMYESIDKQQKNMVVEAIEEEINNFGAGDIPWSLANPDWSTVDDGKTLHIQRKIKDLLNKTVAEYLNNEINKDAPRDEHGNLEIKSLQDKIENPETPIEKHELHLIQIISHLNEEIEPIIDKKWDISQSDLEPLISAFLEEADFNSFVMGILIERSKEGIHNFIHNYTAKTIERTFVPEVFLGATLPNLDKERFMSSMELFDSKFRTQKSSSPENFVEFIYEGPEVIGSGEHVQENLEIQDDQEIDLHNQHDSQHSNDSHTSDESLDSQGNKKIKEEQINQEVIQKKDPTLFSSNSTNRNSQISENNEKIINKDKVLLPDDIDEDPTQKNNLGNQIDDPIEDKNKVTKNPDLDVMRSEQNVDDFSERTNVENNSKTNSKSSINRLLID